MYRRTRSSCFLHLFVLCIAFTHLTGCRESASLAGLAEDGSSVDDAFSEETFRVGGCPQQGLNLIQNGGFEAPRVSDEYFDILPRGSSIGAWLVEDGAVDHISRRLWRAAERRQSVDLNHCSAGIVGQEIPTTPGRSYQLCFAMAGNPDGPPAGKALEVWWGSSRVDSLTFDATDRTRRHMGWSYRQYVVTAVGESMRLRFRSITPGCYGPVIDDVKLLELEPPSI